MESTPSGSPQKVRSAFLPKKEPRSQRGCCLQIAGSNPLVLLLSPGASKRIFWPRRNNAARSSLTTQSAILAAEQRTHPSHLCTTLLKMCQDLVVISATTAKSCKVKWLAANCSKPLYDRIWICLCKKSGGIKRSPALLRFCGQAAARSAVACR